jgi:small conductance mechanosensitive channel
VIDAGVGYGADIDKVMEVMHEVAAKMRADPAWADQITADFEMAGVNEWGDSAVTVRGRFRVQPGKQWGVKREMLRRLKYAFDAAGIEIPFPQRTVHLVRSPSDHEAREAAALDAA